MIYILSKKDNTIEEIIAKSTNKEEIDKLFDRSIEDFRNKLKTTKNIHSLFEYSNARDSIASYFEYYDKNNKEKHKVEFVIREDK